MHIAKIACYSPCEFDKFAENTAIRREKRLLFIYQIRVFYENRAIIPPARDIIPVFRNTLPKNRIVFPQSIPVIRSIFFERMFFIMGKNLDNRSTTAPKKRAPRTVCNPEDIRYAMPAETSAKIKKISEAFDAAFRELPDSPTNKAKKLFPFVGDIAHSSKIAAPTGKDVRHVNLRILAAMRAVYGIDINAIVDKWVGC